MPILNSDEFKRAVHTIVALGATAAVLAKVSKLASNPTTDLATICTLLKNDGPLAADIIRISNSSFYAAASPHGNLNSAINYIGLREVVRVINLSIARQLFARDLSSYDLSAQEYWSTSVATALVMEALAKCSGLDREDAYTIGIMHAIGQVLIDRIIRDQGYAFRWNGRERVEDWERASVGFDYAETGSILLEHWLFPISTCEVVRWQLDPGKVVEPVSQLGALQFTRRLLALTGADFANRGWQIPETDPYVQAAGLTPAHADHLVADCADNLRLIRQSVDF